MTGSITRAPEADLSQSPGLDTSGGPGLHCLPITLVTADVLGEPAVVSPDDVYCLVLRTGELYRVSVTASDRSPGRRGLEAEE